ncbi:XRE family transcriptional regulator [Anaerospora hongkongensis]|uniref:XRE family transcriptional regulator n=1 Tax=Anaerospora hongkongensis TaxID=244830 RepID=UPI0010539B21|nr:XRE family transcriptional regulator [Anaerospora hongkongensis]
MRLNSARVQQLFSEYETNPCRVARQTGISRGALSNALAGRRTVGKKLLAGLIRAFPGETIETLTLPDRQVAI